jgi:hypothetical protein
MGAGVAARGSCAPSGVRSMQARPARVRPLAGLNSGGTFSWSSAGLSSAAAAAARGGAGPSSVLLRAERLPRAASPGTAARAAPAPCGASAAAPRAGRFALLPCGALAPSPAAGAETCTDEGRMPQQLRYSIDRPQRRLLRRRLHRKAGLPVGRSGCDTPHRGRWACNMNVLTPHEASYTCPAVFPSMFGIEWCQCPLVHARNSPACVTGCRQKAGATARHGSSALDRPASN